MQEYNIHYVIQLKANQTNLNATVKDCLETKEDIIEQQEVLQENKEDSELIEQATQQACVCAVDTYEQTEKNHGRHSKWKASVYNASDIPDPKNVLPLWKGLSSIIAVERTVTYTNAKHAKKNYSSISYYLSDIKDKSAEFFLKGIRGHWAIENNLHWEKDTALNEDKNRIKHPVAATFFSMINTFSVNFLHTLNFKGVKSGSTFFRFNFKEIVFGEHFFINFQPLCRDDYML
jgi:predicted transposase YbfD/YdcC